jgi:DNA-directed RNA polymerase specialized sigma24 family protein
MSPEEAKALVFQHWQYLERIANKRFPYDGQLADQALDYLLDKLEVNQWRRIREYQGRGFTAFISVTANRLITDFCRKIGEVPHVPKWINQRGAFWKKAYFLLCVKGINRQEATHLLTDEARTCGLQADFVKTVVLEILSREKLKERKQFLSVENENIDEPVSAELNPADCLEQSQVDQLSNLLFQLLDYLTNDNNENTRQQAITPQLDLWLTQLKPLLTLSSEEYLLLRLIYQEGLQVTEAGRRLHLNTNQVQGRHRRLLSRLLKAFQSCNLEQELRELL